MYGFRFEHAPQANRKITPMNLRCSLRILSLATVAWLCAATTTQAQLTGDQQAEMLLNSARKAYNDKNYAFATIKFREYLGKFGNHKDVAAGRYGLALTLIEGPDKKYDEARDILQTLANTKEFPDRALASYYAGIAGSVCRTSRKPTQRPTKRRNIAQAPRRISLMRCRISPRQSLLSWRRSKCRSKTTS